MRNGIVQREKRDRFGTVHTSPFSLSPVGGSDAGHRQLRTHKKPGGLLGFQTARLDVE